MQTLVFRPNGSDYSLWTPEPSPDGLLDAIDWPDDIRTALEDYDAAYFELQQAIMDHEDALAEATHHAGTRDGELLRTALHAGKKDPGTPNQVAATRAEHVSFVNLTEVIAPATIARMTAAHQIVNEWFTNNRDVIADRELLALDTHAEARRLLAEAEAHETAARLDVGALWRGLRGWNAGRYSPDIDDAMTMIAETNGYGMGNGRHNDEVKSFFSAVAGGDLNAVAGTLVTQPGLDKF